MTESTRPRNHMAIKEDMTIYNAVFQKSQLLNALADCEELHLDLSQVEEMDTAGFQVLLLAKREAMNTGKSLHLTAHSKAVTELLDLYNMASFFGDPLVIPANERMAGKAER